MSHGKLSEFEEMFDKMAQHVNNGIDAREAETGKRGISDEEYVRLLEEFLTIHPNAREVLDSYAVDFAKSDGVTQAMRIRPLKPGEAGYLTTELRLSTMRLEAETKLKEAIDTAEEASGKMDIWSEYWTSTLTPTPDFVREARETVARVRAKISVLKQSYEAARLVDVNISGDDEAMLRDVEKQEKELDRTEKALDLLEENMTKRGGEAH